MKKIQSLIITATLLVAATTTAYAGEITEVLTGSDNNFGYSLLHKASGCDSMCGGTISKVSLSTNHTSFFNRDLSGNNFKLYLTLDKFSDSLLTLSGELDFDVSEGQLIGNISADFADNTVHSDTFFKFVKGTSGVGGDKVPNPNGFNDDFTLMSLWGANSSGDPVTDSIGFTNGTADLGIDLVVRWDDSTTITEVSEPASLLLFALGLFGLGTVRLRKSAAI